jgi:hypothetical protein
VHYSRRVSHKVFEFEDALMEEWKANFQKQPTDSLSSRGLKPSWVIRLRAALKSESALSASATNSFDARFASNLVGPRARA